MTRISAVNHIEVNEVVLGSTFFIGDMVEFKPLSLALAVQRQVPTYLGREGSFAAYPLFSRPIPLPEIYEEVHVHITNSSPLIKVDNIDVISVSSSSLLQVGSSKVIQAEDRTKNIRQLLPKGTPKPT